MTIKNINRQQVRKHISPDLVLQEVHVAVKQSVGGAQNSHRLHPRSSFQFTLHRHVSKTRQAKVASFTEISGLGVDNTGNRRSHKFLLHTECILIGGSQQQHIHEVTGDPMGTAGHGFELNSVQVDVMRQAPFYHVTCHPHTN